MSMRMGEKFPNLTGCTQSTSEFDLYKYLGDCWGLLLFYPHDSHAVATTDLAAAHGILRQFDERGVLVAGLTVGTDGEAHQRYCNEDLHEWVFGTNRGTSSGTNINSDSNKNEIDVAEQTIISTATATGTKPIQQQMFPLVMLSHDQAKDLGVLDDHTTTSTTTTAHAALSNSTSTSTSTTVTTTATSSSSSVQVHSVTVILKPDRTVACLLWYPSTSGRMFPEIVRLLDSLQLHVNMSVSTPANWQSGGHVLLDSSVSDEEAMDLFGEEAFLSVSDLVIQEDHPEDTNNSNNNARKNNKHRPELSYMRWTKDPTTE